jgi:hypothetical protein
LRDVDIAMYRAKWDVKNRYAVFESGMQDKVTALQRADKRRHRLLVLPSTGDPADQAARL